MLRKEGKKSGSKSDRIMQLGEPQTQIILSSATAGDGDTTLIN